MTEIVNENENDVQLPEEEQETVVTDNGTTYESQESAIIARDEADRAKQWAEESERQANISTQAKNNAITAKNQAVSAKNAAVEAKNYAESAITDTNLITVATDLQANPSKIKTVANNIKNVNTVAGISSSVTAVANNSTNINAVNSNKTNINTVAGISSAITAVAGNAANINAVNENATDISTVAGISDDVSKVAYNIVPVKNVALHINAVNTVYDNIDEILGVYMARSAITGVWGIKNQVTAVAAIDDEVTAVAGISSSVSAVGSNISSVNSVAENMTAVTSAVTYATLAHDWAVKMDGLVNNEDYSSKYYAQQANQYAQSVNPDNIVHKSGTETITGTKTFTNMQILNSATLKCFNFARGTNPETTQYANFYTTDSTASNGDNTALGLFRTRVEANGKVTTLMRAFKNNTAGTNNSADIQVIYPASGSPYTYAPTPTEDTTSSTQIDTVGARNTKLADYVNIASSQTITGQKTFQVGHNGVIIKNRTANGYSDLTFMDDSDNLIGKIRGGVNSSNQKYAALFTDVDYATVCQPTADTTTSSQIDTVGARNTKLANYVTLADEETITGAKLFTGGLYRKNTSQTKGTTPSSTVYNGIVFRDSANKEMGSIQQSYSTAKTNSLFTRIYKANASSDNDYIFLTLVYPTSSDAYAQIGCIFKPSTDNSFNLGTAAGRWKQLFAGTTTISTSDERLKQQIDNVPDAVLDAWGEVGFYQYKFNDAVEEKGDNARYHTGMIAQRIKDTFENAGINPFIYGLLCYDEWEATEAEYDEEGNEIVPAQEAGNRYSLRYEECLCMEAAYQRRRADRIEARLRAIEEKLDNLPNSEYNNAELTL